MVNIIIIGKIDEEDYAALRSGLCSHLANMANETSCNRILCSVILPYVMMGMNLNHICLYKLYKNMTELRFIPLLIVLIVDEPHDSFYKCSN